MKKIWFAAFLLFTCFSQAQNSLLNGDFWKKAPDVPTVKAEIAKGNSPSEANGGNHDVVSMAINNNAPLETILYLLEQEGNSIDKTTHDGRIYLHWAASRGNVALVKFLLEQGSEIKRTDDKGAIPIAFAAANGQTNPEVYELLYTAGNDPKQKFQNGANLLLLSIANDKELKLTEYLTSKGLSLQDTDDLGNTAFNYAARTGDVTFLRNLKDKGVKYDERALIFAAQGSRFSANPIATYTYLVEDLKLNPNAVGDGGENVLHNLVRKQKQEEIIAYFLEKGVDINHQDNEGNTVLMNATRGSVEVVKLFFPKVKDVNLANTKGLTALSFAVNSGSPEMVAFLIKNGVDVNVKDVKGNNLVYHAIEAYRPGPARENEKDAFIEKLDLLKQAGLDLASPQADGNTLYHLAVTKNDIDLLEKIEGFGADINAQNSEGMTALHKAALTAKDDSILKYLISKGAKKNILTEFDETAYALASENESLIANNVPIDFLK